MKKFLKFIGVALLAFICIGLIAAACTDTEATDTSALTEPTTATTKTETVAEETAPDISISQRNAVRSAEAYLDFMAFSRDGLIEQLEFDGFTAEQAAHAADALGY